MLLVSFVQLQHWQRCRRGEGEEPGGSCSTPGQGPTLCDNVGNQDTDLIKLCKRERTWKHEVYQKKKIIYFWAKNTSWAKPSPTVQPGRHRAPTDSAYRSWAAAARPVPPRSELVPAATPRMLTSVNKHRTIARGRSKGFLLPNHIFSLVMVMKLLGFMECFSVSFHCVSWLPC